MAHHYATTMALSLLGAKLLYQNQRCDIAITKLNDAMTFMSDALDRHEFYVSLQEVYITISQPEDAFRVNRAALAELGFHIPYRTKEFTAEQLVEAETIEVTMENLAQLPYSEKLVSMLMAEFDRKISKRSIQSLIDELPPCTDRRHAAVASLLSSIITSCYMYACEFTLPMTLLSTMHMLDHGITGQHAHGCLMLAEQVLIFPKIIRSVLPLALSDLALAIINRYPHASSEPKTRLVHAVFQLWYRPFAECERYCESAMRSATENGVPLFVSYALVIQSELHGWTLNLAEMKAELAQFKMVNQRVTNDLITTVRLESHEACLSILEDSTFDIDDTDGSPSDADKAHLEHADHVSFLCLVAYRVWRGFVFYIMNQPFGAVEILASDKFPRTTFTVIS